MTLRFVGSFVRVLVATTAGLALLAGSCFVGVRAYGIRRLEATVDSFVAAHGPLQPGAHTLPSIPAHLNGATWMLKGAQDLEWSDSEREQVFLAAVTRYASWSFETRTDAASAIQRNRDAIAAFAYAASLPESSFEVDYSLGHFSPLPPLLRLLAGGRLLAAATRLHAAEGSETEARRCMSALSGLGRGLEVEIDVALQQSGWTAENMLLSILAEHLESPVASPFDGDLWTLDQLPDVDLAGQFDRYLAWRVASAAPLTAGANRESWLWRPDAAPVGPWWMPVAQAMTRELWAAHDLEESMAEIAGLQGPIRSAWNSSVSHERVPGIFPLELISARMRLINSSRQVVHSALRVRRSMWLPGGAETRPTLDEVPAPISGGTASRQVFPDGSVRIEITGIDHLARRAFAARLNPPPPLTVTVPPGR